MKQYPLIEKLNLKTFDTQRMIGDVVRARDLEQVLQNATVVYGYKGEANGKMVFGEAKNGGDDLKALLLAIEPLEQKKVTITRQTINDLVGKFLNDDIENYSGDFSQYIIKELGL